jgi:TonB family protein
MKFCGKCEEAFADRFAFCPNCGGELQTYEMNPVTAQPAAEAQSPPQTNSLYAEPVTTPVILAEAAAGDADVLEIPEFESAQTNGNGVAEEVTAEMPVMAAAPVIAAASEPTASFASPSTPVFVSEPKHEVSPVDKQGWREVKSKNLVPPDDGLYHITMVDNKTIFTDPRFRTAGIFALATVLTLSIGSVVYSLFDQYVNVNSPEAYELVSAVYISDDPVDVEHIQMKKDNDTGGGGGGGGRNDPNPASEGRMAPMFKDKPMLTPSKEDISVTEPVMAVTRGLQANKDFTPENDGRPMGAGIGKIPSDGPGGPLGQGSGQGEGQGPGKGPGYGPGSGGGFGGGSGGGFGPGNGPGGPGGDEAPAMPKGPSVALKIISKPQPQYTEEARKNQISGTVRLKVIFNSNGSVGSITAVSGLGYGLTEKAISAARNIRFEPQLKNGVPTSISKTIEYNFNLY